MANVGAVCPECGYPFKGNGFDGIDAHWRAEHESVMTYKEAWPLIKSGCYTRSPGSKQIPAVTFTKEQRQEYERLMARVFGSAQKPLK